MAAFQSLGISDDTKERLNRLVIGVATISADNFRKRGSRLSSLADLYGSRFCSSFRTSAIWIWIWRTEKAGASRCGGCGAVGRGWSSQEESVILGYHRFIGGDGLT